MRSKAHNPLSRIKGLGSRESPHFTTTRQIRVGVCLSKTALLLVYSCQDRTLVVAVPSALFNAPDTICEFRAPITNSEMGTPRHPAFTLNQYL
jgi:hypothetical protein